MTITHLEPSVDEHGHPVCEVCGQPIDPQRTDVFSLTIGWVQNRTGGGAHAISGRKDLGRYRHVYCHRFGRQESLF